MSVKDKQTLKKSNFQILFPGLNYLGPGNIFPNGVPQSEADGIAFQHDFLYSKAKSINEIKSADILAIKKCSKLSSIDGISGNIGLRLKSSFENIFAHVYPKMSDEEDWRNKKRKDGQYWNKGNKL